jgi:hypothetical protein
LTKDENDVVSELSNIDDNDNVDELDENDDNDKIAVNVLSVCCCGNELMPIVKSKPENVSSSYCNRGVYGRLAANTIKCLFVCEYLSVFDKFFFV